MYKKPNNKFVLFVLAMMAGYLAVQVYGSWMGWRV